MDNLHKSLEQQIKRHFGSLDKLPAEWHSFIEAVNQTYRQSEEDHKNLTKKEQDLSVAHLQLETSLQQMGAQEEILQETAEKAEAANIAKSEFLANMSHEIRTPLNAIIGMTELVLDTELSSEQRGYINVVQSASEGLLSVINDILDFSKIEAGEMEIEEIDFNLSEVVEIVKEMFKIPAAGKGIELICEVDPKLPSKVIGDPTKLRQTLVNLVGNAIKFTEQGQVSIQAEAPNLSQEKNEQLKNVELIIEVRDTGPGIPQAKLDQIFQKFSQADSTISRKFGGTGLGLNIARSFVEIMGGHLWVESEEGVGTTFYFKLNLPVAENLPAAEVNSTGGFNHLDVQGPKARIRKKILLAEDNVDNQLLTTNMLEKAGFAVDVAENGKLAAEAVQLFRYDLIVMDVYMPIMDGFAATHEIRCYEEKHGLSPVPIIAYTAHAVEGYREVCLQSGMDDFMTKPVKRKALLKTIEKWIDPRPTILIVEDVVDNQNLIKNQLGKESAYNLVFADDGQKGIEQFEQRAISLVLMDMEMPVMDGYSATQALRQLEYGNDVPIIAMTAHQGVQERNRCYEAGCSSYITKPIRKNDLKVAISKLLRAENS